MPLIQTTKVYSELENALQQGFTTISEQGNARSSKTYNTIIWLMNYCLRFPFTRVSIVRATLPALKGSVFIDFREIMMRMLLYDEKRLNKSELTYQFSNGSWIEFFSCDSEQKLRGRKRDVLFVNEANELSFIEWQQLKMRTTKLAILDYNPSFTDEHWLCGLNSDKNTYHFITTYKDNPFLEKAVIDEIESLKKKNKSLWTVYGLGLQAIIEGLVFTNFDVIDYMPAKLRRVWIGMDFGYTNDATAICRVGLDGNDIYIDEVCYRTQMLTEDIIRELKGIYPPTKIISESADPRLVEEIYRAGLNIHPVKKYKGSIEAGITKMMEYNIHITRDSANVIKEFKNYTWAQDKEGKWLNTPIDFYNHAIDAVRYVIMSEVMGGEKRPVNLEKISQMIY